MTSHLYVLSIGPVQGFIAAARRTRDLWMGSLLLSEISKAAAKKIVDMNGTLIFPALDSGSEDLEPALPDDPDRTSPAKLLEAFNVANIIRAKIPGTNLSKFDADVKEAARQEWLKYANSARNIVEANDKGSIDTPIWDEQVKDVIEFYSAWVPLNENDPEAYREAQKRLMRLLTARKSTRDFIPAGEHWGVEKSSLDGARERVLIKPKPGKHFSRDLTLRLRLRNSEQLCAVGLTKRLGGSKVPFPSVSRVALDPWIREIMQSGEEYRAILNLIRSECKDNKTFASGTGQLLYQDFPFDGHVLYPERLNVSKQDIESLITDFPDYKDFGDDKKRIENIEPCAKKLWERFGEPNPYLAVMVADGDRMGKVISHIESCPKHREFSEKLAEFAKETRGIIEMENHGVLVFAGGEDILAFLPVDTCIDAARKLHDKFGELLEGFPDDEEGHPPTLSVGIAIGHFLDPLEDLLKYGRDAESDAKEPDRNGLAVHWHTRGGGDPIKVRQQWKDVDGLDKRLNDWVGMYRADKFPDGAAYDLRRLADDYRGWEKEKIPEELLLGDIGRLLKRKRTEGGTKALDEEDIETVKRGVTTFDDLALRAEELVLARKIAVASGKAGVAGKNEVIS